MNLQLVEYVHIAYEELIVMNVKLSFEMWCLLCSQYKFTKSLQEPASSVFRVEHCNFFFRNIDDLQAAYMLSRCRRQYSWSEYNVKDSHLLLKYAEIRGGTVRELPGAPTY